MSKSKARKAVALKYNVEQDMAPVVIASGYGDIADRIIDIAEQKGIPVYRDDSAASLMCMLDVGSNIPPELYDVIAVIYGQIMQTAAEIKNKYVEPQVTTTLAERQANFTKKRSALDAYKQSKDKVETAETDSGDDSDDDIAPITAAAPAADSPAPAAKARVMSLT